MMQSLSRPVRRALALGLLTAVLVAAASTTLLPFLSTVDDLHERIAQNRELVARLRAATTSSGGDAADWQRDLADASRRNFISGTSQTIRLANVQSAVVGSLNGEGAKPKSVRNLPPRQRAGLTLIGVQVQVTAKLPQVQAILSKLDAHQPRLIVEDLQITPAQGVSSAGEPNQRLLDLRMDIFGIEAPVIVGEAKP